MMEMAQTGLSWVLLAGGAFFFVVAGIGLIRMPDVYTRMHASSIADTAGAGLMLTGMMVAAGFSLISVKLIVILAIILFTSPIATHALAQAARHAGVEPILSRKARRRPAGSKARATGEAATKAKKRGRSRKAREVTP